MPESQSQTRDWPVNLSAPFIDRPVATTLLTIGIALAGVVAFRLLPVSAAAGRFSNHLGAGTATGSKPRNHGGNRCHAT